MAEPARAPATYRDLLDLPDHVVGEIVAGELHVSPRPAIPHAKASSLLGSDLIGPFWRGRGGPGGWWIVFEPELHLGGDALVPDLAGWRRSRLPELPSSPAMELAPCWVCEVLSPSTARLDRTGKMAAYAREGIQWLWLLDPLQRTLEAYRLEEGRWWVLGVFVGPEPARIEPFDAIELELQDLWGPEPDTTT